MQNVHVHVYMLYIHVCTCMYQYMCVHPPSCTLYVQYNYVCLHFSPTPLSASPPSSLFSPPPSLPLPLPPPLQEFIACGAMNIVGSLFSSFTAAGSLSRSLVQANSGGKTQLVGFVSSGLPTAESEGVRV